MSEARSEGFTSASIPEGYLRHLAPLLFDPWAEELVARAAPSSGATVVDLACGPGTVARRVAACVGRTGRVIGVDISEAMLEIAAAQPAKAGWAALEYVRQSASDLEIATASVALVLCQQGLQFFPDPLAALREMHRVLEPGGVVALSTWAAERPLGLFGAIADAVRASGAAEPYPNAFQASSYAVSADELRGLLEAAGFVDVRLETVTLRCTWPTAEAVLATIGGTPFAPIVSALGPQDRAAVDAELLRGLGHHGDGEVRVLTVSHISHARKPADGRSPTGRV